MYKQTRTTIVHTFAIITLSVTHQYLLQHQSFMAHTESCLIIMSHKALLHWKDFQN